MAQAHTLSSLQVLAATVVTAVVEMMMIEEVVVDITVVEVIMMIEEAVVDIIVVEMIIIVTMMIMEVAAVTIVVEMIITIAVAVLVETIPAWKHNVIQFSFRIYLAM
jgi:hypothetical protein